MFLSFVKIKKSLSNVSELNNNEKNGESIGEKSNNENENSLPRKVCAYGIPGWKGNKMNSQRGVEQTVHRLKSVNKNVLLQSDCQNKTQNMNKIYSPKSLMNKNHVRKYNILREGTFAKWENPEDTMKTFSNEYPHSFERRHRKSGPSRETPTATNFKKAINTENVEKKKERTNFPFAKTGMQRIEGNLQENNQRYPAEFSARTRGKKDDDITLSDGDHNGGKGHTCSVNTVENPQPSSIKRRKVTDKSQHGSGVGRSTCDPFTKWEDQRSPANVAKDGERRITVRRKNLHRHSNEKALKNDVVSNSCRENKKRDAIFGRTDVVKNAQEVEKQKKYLFLRSNGGAKGGVTGPRNKKNGTHIANVLKNDVRKNIWFKKIFNTEEMCSIVRLNYDDNLSNIQKKENEKVKVFYSKYYKCALCLDEKSNDDMCLKKHSDVLGNYCKFCKKFLRLLMSHGTKHKGTLINVNLSHPDIQNVTYTYKCDKQHFFTISLFHIIHNLWCPHDDCLFQCKNKHAKNYTTEFFRLKELDTMEKQKNLFLQAKIFCLFNSYGALPVSSKSSRSECTNDVDRIIKSANNPWEVLQIKKFSKIEPGDKAELKKVARKNYHKLALKVHPDKNKSSNASLAMNILTNSMKTIMSM
ncbi:DnaJ protein, putative [Plasmodium ovale]|uniref:DnaJ protein, putative n=1 Tax=Plasmodium ovale TaxID=36330 RepID=A0A1C3KSN5_PLAOA|nr:DnaJ protein, putative [Plasmodium ovale]